MNENPPCAVCGELAWKPAGERVFRRADVPDTHYRKLRHDVLFELWSPGVSDFRARFVVCRVCGFFCYLPRASADQVHQKYEYIAQHTPEAASKRTISPLDRARSNDFFRYVRPFFSGRSVLDFGGGNGALLCAFADAGIECSVVDYTKESVPGVKRLGATLDELSDDDTFDAVLASHVLEHVAEPVDIVKQLGKRLNGSGILIVEVPLEILGGPPNMREPVTHVNFFCRSSLSATLERAGLRVLTCSISAARFESGSYRYAVRAIAQRTDQIRPFVAPSSREAESLLAAGRVRRALYLLRHPRIALGKRMARV